MNVSEADRARGSLLGLAWGDVMGCPVEYWSQQLIAQVYGRYDTLPARYPWSSIPREPFYWGHLRPLGLHSDDTQQALALVQASLNPRGFSPDLWAECLLLGERACAWRGTGRNFRAALASLARGVTPSRSGAASAGIGAAMRIAPLGVVYRADHATLRRVVLESSYTTHADLRAAALAFGVAVTCALLVPGARVTDVRAALPNLVAQFEAEAIASPWVEVSDAGQLHAVSENLHCALTTDWSDAAVFRAWLREQAPRHGIPDRELDLLPNHPFVLLGGVHALTVGLWPNGTATELLAELVQQGGDTDTAGAIAGAVLGARYGTAWIPAHRMTDSQALCAYASALVTCELPETFEALLEREARLTTLERAFLAERSRELSGSI